MPKYCFICGRKIDTIGYYVNAEDGFICETCASKCSLRTQGDFHSKSRNELIKEISEFEWNEVRSRPKPKVSKRVKGNNRFAFIVLAVFALLILVLNIFNQSASNRESNASKSTTAISAYVSTKLQANRSLLYYDSFRGVKYV